METKTALVFYQDVPVRKKWHNGEQWIAALDIAKALGYDNPSREASRIISRNKDRFEGYTCTPIMGVQSENGIIQKRKIVFLNLKGVIAFCMLCELKSAIPFQRWADSILEKHINKIPDDIKLIAKTKRVKFTDDLKEHGVNKQGQYIQITKSMKENLGIEKDKPKSECDLIEIMKIAAAEDIARINMLQENPSGYYQVKPVCDQSAKAVVSATKKEVLK